MDRHLKGQSSSQTEASAEPVVPSHNPQAGSTALTLTIDCLLLTCLFALVLVFSNKPGASMDEDLWWHLRTGNWIFEHHSVPRQDSFSAPMSGRPWIVYTWLFDVVVSAIYSKWQLSGTLAFTSFLMVACILALTGLLSRYIGLRSAAGLSFAALFGIIVLASPRPWLLTVLLYILELGLLFRARESYRPIWLLPLLPLFLLWANLHVQFVYGLLAIGLFAIERPFAHLLGWGTPSGKLPARWFWITLAVCILTTLANPYGWKLYRVVAEYATQKAPLSVIQEMQPMQFRSIIDWIPLVLTCWAFSVSAGFKRKDPVLILLLVTSCWFGFRSGRDVRLLATTSLLAIAHAAPLIAKKYAQFRWTPWVFAATLSLALGFSMLHAGEKSQASLRAALRKRFPEAAANYIETHRLPNPLFNTFSWGGFLIWRLPNMPVSIDGRANLYGDTRLLRFIDTWRGKSDWSSDPELRKAHTILLDLDCPLASILRSDPRFHLVYQDEIAVVFEPAGAR